MSQLDDLRKRIRSLPYADMLQLTTELCTQLSQVKHPATKLNSHQLADALLAASNVAVDESDQTLIEEEAFSKIFKVQRAVQISKQKPRGWELNFKSIPGSNSVGAQLRPLWNQSLDQIVTLHLMGQ
jgi:hypothetical protein